MISSIPAQCSFWDCLWMAFPGILFYEKKFALTAAFERASNFEDGENTFLYCCECVHYNISIISLWATTDIPGSLQKSLVYLEEAILWESSSLVLDSWRIQSDLQIKATI